MASVFRYFNSGASAPDKTRTLMCLNIATSIPRSDKSFYFTPAASAYIISMTFVRRPLYPGYVLIATALL